MKQLPLRIALLLLLVVVSMLYGMVSYSQGLPPYPQAERLYSRLFGPDVRLDPAADSAEDAPSALRYTDATAIADARARLVSLLWGDSALPDRLPDAVYRGHEDPLLGAIAGLARIDRLVIEMDFDLSSTAYHFVPQRPNNRVVVYHAGHDQVLAGAAQLIEILLKQGYAVVGVEMPLEGGNRDAARARVAGGTLDLRSHAQFSLLRPDRGHPLRYFIEPVVVAINHVLHEYAYDGVAMIGLSGGGWTTTLAAALDPRIRLSIPVAGSYPRYLRHTQAEYGDWEQRAPDVYALAGYRELYVLGAHGAGRRQLQVLNVNDPCCFSGYGWKTYAGQVVRAIRAAGPGEFRVFADDSHDRHAISAAAMLRILQELGK
ncbi:MAG: hypothetical protein WD054_03530 [Gemmatimonadota bacterium]